MNENTRIVQGFHNDKDRQILFDKFNGYKVKSKGIIPPAYYEIIGRVGNDGAWVYRELNNKRQWYLTHDLEWSFEKI